MRKRILSMALLSAVNAIAAVSVLRLIQYLEDGFDHTNHGKIVDLSGTLSQTIFELPVGWMRRFVIEIDGKKVFSFQSSSETASQCNWLDHVDYTVGILDINSPEILDKIEAGTLCKLTVNMTDLPNLESSVWLAYVYKPCELKRQTKPINACADGSGSLLRP